MSPVNLSLNSKTLSASDNGDGTFTQRVQASSADQTVKMDIQIISSSLLFNTDEEHTLSVTGT
jgi:hypothetical protein